jgi:DNA phosphorothioation-dependent restriction protein DptG
MPAPAQDLLILCDLPRKSLEFLPGLLEFYGNLFVAQLEALK